MPIKDASIFWPAGAYYSQEVEVFYERPRAPYPWRKTIDLGRGHEHSQARPFPLSVLRAGRHGQLRKLLDHVGGFRHSTRTEGQEGPAKLSGSLPPLQFSEGPPRL